MKRYCGSIMAVRIFSIPNGQQVQSRHKAVAITAADDDQAGMDLLALCGKEFPEEDGWREHSVQFVECVI